MEPMEFCENCHSLEIYPVKMLFLDNNGEPVLEQRPVMGHYCVDCGVFINEEE